MHRSPLPPGLSWYSFLEAELTPGHMELSDATEKSLATPGIDPGTFQLVAQCLNHYTTPGSRILVLFLFIYMYIYIYKTRLASNEIFSPSNKIHREVGKAKHLSAPRYMSVYILTLNEIPHLTSVT
jgi:hypothetical protein